MQITFLGHSSFLITTSSGTRIVTDPYDPEKYPGMLLYKPFHGAADIVTISHQHPDHNNFAAVKGKPIVIDDPGKFGAADAEFRGVETFHDESRGKERGRNVVFVIRADGLSIAHMGDLGHVINADQAAEIGDVDIVLVPVGGNYTIDAEQAQEVVNRLAANIVIPMHYSNEKCQFPLAGVDEFIKGKPNVTRKGTPVLEVSKETLPREQQIVVLEPSM